MFESNGRKNYKQINDSIMWALFIIIATAVTFFVVITISKENSEVFSTDLSGATAASQNVVEQDVSVMIISVE